MILNLSGHLGSNVSALVDGQLSDEAAERAWDHVLTCSGCRALVEQEGWLKSSLSVLAGSESVPSAMAPAPLASIHYAATAWAEPAAMAPPEPRRRLLPAVLAGTGTVGIAMAGLMAVSSPSTPRAELPSQWGGFIEQRATQVSMSFRTEEPDSRFVTTDRRSK